jgi:hypothetical protein
MAPVVLLEPARDSAAVTVPGRRRSKWIGPTRARMILEQATGDRSSADCELLLKALNVVGQ